MESERDGIISPRAPARQSVDQDWRRYVRKAAGVLRSASSVRGSFTVTGKLAPLLAQQRTPMRDRSWNARALRDNVAKALAEIDGLMRAAASGDEAAKGTHSAIARRGRIHAASEGAMRCPFLEARRGETND
jgi:hypothetical protein